MIPLAAAAAISTTGPSWYWYATRGLGVSTVILLTMTVVLGIVTAARWSGDGTPGFVTAELHRNFSLLSMFLLAVHIVTTVLGPFAHIRVRDVIVPVGAAYRPLWLGLGVVAMEILVLVAGSSILRERIGARAWRLIHWTAYASWPLSLVHGLGTGTGSDARAPWFIGIAAACVAAVLVVVTQRLRIGPAQTLPLRSMAAVAAATIFTLTGLWAFSGPLQDGWAVKAGTPPVKAAPVKPGPVHPGPGGFSDPLVGVMVRDSGGVQISMRDTVDTALTVTIRSANNAETLPVVTIGRAARVLCSVPASAGTTL